MDTKDVLRMRVHLGNDVPDLFYRLANCKRPGRVLVSLAQRGLQAELESQARLMSFSEAGGVQPLEQKASATFANLSVVNGGVSPKLPKSDSVNQVDYGELMDLGEAFFQRA